MNRLSGLSRAKGPIALIGERMAILHHRSYRWFISGYAVSRLGDGIQYLTTAWLALHLGSGSTSLVWTFTASTVPALVIGPVASVAVDRSDCRRLAIGLDIAQGITVTAIVVCFWAGILQAWLLYILVFVLAALKQVYVPTIRTLVHHIVGDEALLDANATTAAASQAGTLVGALVGGWIIAAYSESQAMFLNAVSFFFSAAMIMRMPFLALLSSRAEQRRSVIGAATHYVEELYDGIVLLWQHPCAKPLFLGLLSVYATLAFVNITLPIYVKLNMLDGFVFGLIDSGFAVGGFLGSVLIPIGVRRAGPALIMFCGVFLLGASLASFPWWPVLPLNILGYAAIGFAFQIWLLFMTNMQLVLHADIQARVQAIFGACTGVSSLLIYQLVGLGAEHLSITTIYLVFAVMLTVFATVSIVHWRTKEAFIA
jgi:MFS transporter, DHA3 family, macrolide efflux protein